MAPQYLSFLIPVDHLIHSDLPFNTSIDVGELTKHDDSAGPGYLVRDIKAQIRASGTRIDGSCEFMIDNERFKNEHVIPAQWLQQPIILAPSQWDEIEITLRDRRRHQHTFFAPWEADLAWIQKELGSAGIEIDLSSCQVGLSGPDSIDTYLTDTHRLSDFDLGERGNVLEVYDVFCPQSDRIEIQLTDGDLNLGFFVHRDQPLRYVLDLWVCKTKRDLSDMQIVFQGKILPEMMYTNLTASALAMRAGNVLRITKRSTGGGGFTSERIVRTVHIDPKRTSVGVGSTEHGVCYDLVVRGILEVSPSAGWRDIHSHLDETRQEYMAEAGFWVEEKTVTVIHDADAPETAPDSESDVAEDEAQKESL